MNTYVETCTRFNNLFNTYPERRSKYLVEVVEIFMPEVAAQASTSKGFLFLYKDLSANVVVTIGEGEEKQLGVTKMTAEATLTILENAASDGKLKEEDYKKAARDHAAGELIARILLADVLERRRELYEAT